MIEVKETKTVRSCVNDLGCGFERPWKGVTSHSSSRCWNSPKLHLYRHATNLSPDESPDLFNSIAYNEIVGVPPSLDFRHQLRGHASFETMLYVPTDVLKKRSNHLVTHKRNGTDFGRGTVSPSDVCKDRNQESCIASNGL